MLWLLVAVGLAGLTIGTAFTVHVMIPVSLITVALAAFSALYTGSTMAMTLITVGSALVILQASYLVGACIGASVRSTKAERATPRVWG